MEPRYNIVHTSVTGGQDLDLEILVLQPAERVQYLTRMAVADLRNVDLGGDPEEPPGCTAEIQSLD